MTGTVVKSTGSWYQVRLDSVFGGHTLPCRIVGKFRLNDIPLTNPVAVGDLVTVQQEGGDQQQGLITGILERRNVVARQSPRKKHDMHLLAANIDQAVLVVTVVQPNLKPGFIDRFLLMTEAHEIPVTIVFNKADVYTEDDLELFLRLRKVYTDIGYGVLLTSTHQREGIDALTRLLAHKITLFSGQSGVGKSSLINAIQPGWQLRTGAISDHSGKGQHTTTFAEMLELDLGGAIIDTPGIKTLSFNNRDPENVAHSFREFFSRSTGCRFGGACLHRDEPKCAVKEALNNGEVSELRYLNYLDLLQEAEDQNYWERHKSI